MYEKFYQLKEKPFSLLPQAEHLFPSRKHRTALSLLEYGLMNHASFSVVTGEIGTGKTTLIRHLISRMSRDVTVGMITNTHRSFGELLQWVLFAFNLEYRGKDKVEMYQAILDFLVREYSKRRRAILILDEAQNLAADALEELRMLSNINADRNQVLQVILAGQADLRHTLRQPNLAQFAQRIEVDYHLEPLDAMETAEYIRHRLSVAGAADPDLFLAPACQAVFQSSRGIPRLVNLICDTALVYGFAEHKAKISQEVIHDVIRDKQEGGLHLFEPADAAAGAQADISALPRAAR